MKASYIMDLTNINLESIMLSHVWSSAGYEQWKAMLISIENLLEDDQGLSMGDMLTVNFRQPKVPVIHWFLLWFATNPPLDILMV
jgi:hypothetical protein